jgi:hypothetical protein
MSGMEVSLSRFRNVELMFMLRLCLIAFLLGLI